MLGLRSANIRWSDATALLGVIKLGLATADRLTESLRAYCVHLNHTAQLTRCNSSYYLD